MSGNPGLAIQLVYIWSSSTTNNTIRNENPDVLKVIHVLVNHKQNFYSRQ